MKYKAGDKVKIIASKHGHEFDIGEIVRIAEVYSDNYKADYLDGHDFWWVEDDEIEPANNIITRPHDYTGCDPEIAEALKQGLEVYCEVWDDYDEESIKDWVHGYVLRCEFPYITKETYYLHARPIRQEPAQEPKTKLVPNPASEIFAWLENPENGYYLDEDGDYSMDGEDPSFVTSMLKHCGTDDCGDWEWHPAWLREVPTEVSESSENEPQTATVLEHQTAHLHPDDKVTIVRRDEDGDYLCEFNTGIRIWMRPNQLKFD